ncbi:MAG: hypothetical protein ACI8PZ_006965 [Myxococcota bacterium]|jgi:hypothetical protein
MPVSIPDPSATIPVALPAAEFFANARTDAVARALTSQDGAEWTRTPPIRPPRDWDPTSGTWTDCDEKVPDPSYVDADHITTDEGETEFSFPAWVSDAPPVPMPPPRPADPVPRAAAPRVIAMSTFAAMVIVVGTWLVLG